MSNTESFESVMTYAQAVMSECDIPILDRLKKAHDREIEHARKAEYNRGYEDALRRKETDTWQLDMERAEVARHIDAVTLDGGSHANLSALAAAVYEPSGGWTSGACAMLRERLVRLLGGVSGRPYPTTTYDVLGNERQKAIANLRTWEPDRAFANDKCGEVQIRILYQLLGLGGGMMMDGADAAKDVRDRLIHLLGGDNGTCPNDDGTCPNDGPMLTITDELRKYVAETWDGSMYVNRIPMELRAIADRIDEQFDRICEQQEAVLQDTIDEMVDERDGLLEELDELRGHSRTYPKPGDGVSLTDVLQATIERMADELDETRDALDKATGNWARATDERDELRAELRELRAKLGVIREAVDA